MYIYNIYVGIVENPLLFRFVICRLSKTDKADEFHFVFFFINSQQRGDRLIVYVRWTPERTANLFCSTFCANVLSMFTLEIIFFLLKNKTQGRYVHYRTYYCTLSNTVGEIFRISVFGRYLILSYSRSVRFVAKNSSNRLQGHSW